VHAGWAHSADTSVLDDLNSAFARHPAVVDFWKGVTDALQPTVWRAAAAIIAIIAALRRQFRIAVIIAVAVAGALVINTVVKNAVGRPRPAPPISIEHVGGWSFPSGHAMAAAAVATVLIAVVPWPRGRNRIAVVTFVVILVAAVAASRLALGVHYVTDVIGGLALGVCWSLLVVAMGCAVRLPDGEQDERCDAGGDAVGTERPQ
jgi:membrane-associated phospholipid phosphatase